VRIYRDRLEFAGIHDPGPVTLDAFRLPGAHNRENVAAACLLALCGGLWRSDLDLARLVGLEHRMEPVATRGGVAYVDDSKATNVDAVRVALDAVAESGNLNRLVILLGGRGKEGAPYDLLVDPLRRTRGIVCFGETGPAIADVLANAGVETLRAGGLADAVATAARTARPGDTVLLSPACASFDEFTDFEHRGRVFRSLVEGMSP
jgi:UDP-N-acetylmuramoylalanine--D-glutamate ligase